MAGFLYGRSRLLCALVGGLVFAGVASANTLPDGRIYEQVTPEEKYGSEFTSHRSHPASELGGTKYNEGTKLLTLTIETDYTFQAAADGDGIAFVAAPTVGGNEDQGKGGGTSIWRGARRAVGSSRPLSEGAPSISFKRSRRT